MRMTAKPPNDVPCAELLKDVKQLHEKHSLRAFHAERIPAFAGEVELVTVCQQLNLA
jgi:hypothetical protein